MQIELYDFGPTRSQRCRWAFLEAGIEYKTIDGENLFGTAELKQVHPLGALPAMKVDGKALFESAAICTYIADLVPEKGLVAASGAWERALHDQWTCYVLSEMEAYTWSSARNTFVLPEDKRLSSVFEQNADGFKRGAAPMNEALAVSDYLVGNRFSVTDIIASFTVNWGKGPLQAYLDRLLKRPHCTLNRGEPESATSTRNGSRPDAPKDVGTKI